MDIQIDGKSFDYNNLIKIAKTIDPVNYLDIVHDHLLTSKPMKGIKFDYKSTAENDFTLDVGTSNTCQKCNQIKPSGMFRVISNNGSKFLTNTCDDCRLSYFRDRYNNNPDFREKVKESNKKSYRKHAETRKEYQKQYRSENEERVKAKVRECLKKYYQKNKAKLYEYQKEYRLKNKEKISLYQKKYREKKALLLN
ncbi:hypothetical protein [Chryseobacterium sp. AG363]|uniref:hypothetical protein n=1 Tax=Chryseobacterium sp. AG363 TaxID=2183997 RepID=UPI000E72A158|nr:hypothetical protein [Chryseobacterium sp. AG363]RKE81984.1 hypothetical protein DEU39_1534 [Chryseobacterium sp. AG363]